MSICNSTSTCSSIVNIWALIMTEGKDVCQNSLFTAKGTSNCNSGSRFQYTKQTTRFVLTLSMITRSRSVGDFVISHSAFYADETMRISFNKWPLCPYMVRKPSISVTRTWQISCDIRKWPYLKVHCRFFFTVCLAAILKSEAVFSGHFNSLEETFHD